MKPVRPVRGVRVAVVGRGDEGDPAEEPSDCLAQPDVVFEREVARR